MGELDNITATISAGQSLSAEVDIGVGKSLIGIKLPSNWTTAGLSFQVSVDGGATWGELNDQTPAAIGVGSTAAGAFIGFDPTKLRGVQAIKVRSGTVAAPVAQANTVNLTLVTRLVRGLP